MAARAGVSRALVSIVVRGAPGASEQTRERVLRAVAEIGYRPDTRARLLARSATRLLGVVFNVQHAFHADLLEGLYAAAEQADYEMVLSGITPGRNEGRAVETLLGYRCDALIMLGPTTPTARLAELGTRLPVITVGRRLRLPGVDAVRTGDHEGMRLAVDHLVGLGHREITHVDGGRGAGPTERRRGYRDAMLRHRLGPHIRVVTGGHTAADGARAAEALLAGDPLPSAVVAYDDDCATGLIDTLAPVGVSVPGQLSVVGYDDSRHSRLSHRDLTTVGQDAGRLAQLAVQQAVARLAGAPDAARTLVLSPHLVVRATTAPPAPRAAAPHGRSGGTPRAAAQPAGAGDGSVPAAGQPPGSAPPVTPASGS
ncbi:MAG TPA: LacI family DNA-binding transcriptional regulator [Mycobacteriales bacterium]|nr:LacI family DNA-binding transcriptional regulator [Mycobacteriales bacterium]